MNRLPPKNNETPKPKLTVLVAFIIPKENLSNSIPTKNNRNNEIILIPLSKNRGSFIFIPQRYKKFLKQKNPHFWVGVVSYLFSFFSSSRISIALSKLD
jgi:hypothetical protein